MSLKDCFSKIRIDADDKRDIWAAKARLNGDERGAVQSYMDGLVADIEDARAQLVAQGFEVALPVEDQNVAPAVAGSAGAPDSAEGATAPSAVEQGGGSGDAAPQTARNPVQIERALILGDLASLTTQPDYEAAKGGDVEAAVRLALDLVTDDVVDRVREYVGGERPIIVPVISEESAGRNKIPLAAAEVLAARLGLAASKEIGQSNAPQRTAKTGLERIFASPEFAGPVMPGQAYLMLDDTLTQGATFAAMESHIRAGGGRVVGAVALTGKQYSGTLRLSTATLERLRERHGDVENDFQARTGHDFGALTESEARYLANFEPAEAVRVRIADGGREGGQRADEGSPQEGVGAAARRAALSNLSQQKQDRAALLRARIAEKMRNQTNAGLDPELVRDAVELASLYIESGFRRFRDLLRQVAADMGISERDAEPWVRAAYNQVRDDLELSDGDVSDMDDARAVIAAARAVRAGEASDVPGSSPDLERTGGDAAAPDGDGEAALPAPAGATQRGTGGGARGTRGGAGRSRGGARLPDGGAAPVGTQGDLGLRGEARPEPGAAGGAVDRGSGADRLDGAPVDRLGAEDASRAAADSTSLEAKIAQQRAAAQIPVIPGDRANIDATLPLLYPEQRGDVAKVEERFAKPEGHGILLTNGTGSGKTFSGLGVAYRFWQQGKRNILIVSESQPILNGWDRDAGRMGLTVNRLASTQDAGTGIVSTTYANLGQNNELATRDWDLMIFDEAHNLMQAKDGSETKPVTAFRGLAKHPDHLSTLSQMRRAEEWARARALPDNTQARADAMNALYAKQRADVEALRGTPRPKVLFLSATPFAHDFTLDYAEGFLFTYGENGVTDSGSRQSGRNLFFVSNLGYRIRYHKLTQPEAAVDRGVFQRQLHDRLRQEGALSGRSLTVATDYDRRFNIVADRKGEQIDRALKWWWDLEVAENERNAKGEIEKAIRRHFDYLKRMQLLEAIKARAIIPDVEKHLDMGRKVVIFHDYNVGGGTNPFGISVPDSDEARGLWSRFMAENAYVRDLNFAGYLPPKDALTQHFGARAASYNGLISKNERKTLRERFQDDNSGLDILVVQSDAGSAGIDLHDTTGIHQRVLINIGMPNRPTRILQAEGRIRRIGVVSDAIYRYPFTGTAWERDAFARRIAEQSGTVENFALGSDARRIRDSFIEAFELADTYPVGMEGEGKGGVEIDGQAASVTPYEEAKTHYFGTAQVRANRDRRAGVDWFATPQPLGFKMVEWAGVRPYESVLEPSAGDGAIARYFPANAERTLVDNSRELMSRARLFTGGARHVEDDFESFNIVNKFDAVVMNPPFGSGGKTAMDHVRKAMRHVRPGGRIVALIPTGPAADRQFDVMADSEEAKEFTFVADVALPRVTFERAGTAVSARVVIFDRGGEYRPVKRINLTGPEDINEFFDRLEGISVPDRPAPTQDAADRILDEAVAQAEATPLSVSAPMVSGAPEAAYETFQFPHTRTGAMQYGAQIKERLGDRFAEVRAVAKGHGGDYSSYQNREAGARRGFLFPSEAQRQAFLDDLYKPVVSRDQRLTGPQPTAVFYSPLARALEGAKQASATAADWKAIISKLDGVKRAEVEWLGVEDWLDSQTGQVPREALTAFVRANEIVIEEDVGVEGGEPDITVQTGEAIYPDDWEAEAEFYMDEAREELEARLDEDEDPDDITDEEVQERAEEIARERYEPTEYDFTVYDRNGDWSADGAWNPEDGTYYVDGQSFDSEQDVSDWAEAQAQGPDRFAASFEDYTESGGSNYREILLRVPTLDTDGPNDFLTRTQRAELREVEGEINTIMGGLPDPRANGAYWQLSDADRARYDDLLTRRQRILGNRGPEKRPFVQSSHFEQPNIVVHARVKDRKDADGKRVLFVEEIQSDLASKWRENSEPAETTARRAELRSRLEELDRQRIDNLGATATMVNDALRRPAFRQAYETDTYFQDFVDGQVRDYDMTGEPEPGSIYDRFLDVLGQDYGNALNEHGRLIREEREARDELLRLGTERRMDPSTPETPFLGENTYALMVKRLMRMAADEGYDAIAWTPGYMQAERWNKAGQSVVEAVEWQPGDDRGFRLVTLAMAQDGNRTSVFVNESGIIDDRTVSALNQKPLATLLGPGLAKQIMSEESGSVSGQKIVFPDSGYAIAYDQQVKRSVEKIAKKHGAAVKIDRALPDMGARGPRLDDLTNAQIIDFFRSQGKQDRIDEVERDVQRRKADYIAEQERQIEGLRDNLANPPPFIRIDAEFTQRNERAIAERERNIATVDEKLDATRANLLRQNLTPREKEQILQTAPGVDGRPVWRVDFNDKLRVAAQTAQPLFRQREAEGVDQAPVTAPFARLANKIEADLNARMAKLMPNGGLRLNIVQSLEGEFEDGTRFTADGMFWGNIITVALDSETLGRGAMPTFDHEVIHGLRSERLWGKPYGLFRKAEWDALRKAALADAARMAEIKEVYRDLPLEMQIEEAIADMYGEWAAGRMKNPPSLIRVAFERIKSFLDALRIALRGQGFTDADMVFARIERGDVGARAGVEGGMATDGDAQFAINTETDAFKRWFKDSKVVDADGKPLVVYHGTRASFEAFDGGVFFFADEETADDYAVEAFAEGDPRVIPAYLRMERPASEADVFRVAGVEDDGTSFAFEQINPETVAALKAEGFDGVVLDNDASPSDPGGRPRRSWAVFEPTQIKSVFNRGTFDPADPRIQYARRSGTFSPQALANMRGFAPTTATLPGATGPQQPSLFAQPSFPTPERTYSQAVAERTQDNKRMLFKAQKAFEAVRGAPLPESLDSYLAFTLYDTRTSDQLEKFLDNEVGAITRAMTEEKVTLDEIGAYLMAKHAPERNAEMAKRDPKRFGQDGGSGLTNGQAAQIIADFTAARKTQGLDRVGQMVRKILKDDLARRLSAGLITQAEHDSYVNMYQHYVPLRGSAERDDGAGPVGRMGRGFDVRGKETKAALGRRTVADNPLVQAIQMAQEGIVRTEKNRAAKVFMRLVQSAPNPELWEFIGKLPMRRVLDPATGLVKEMPDLGSLNEDEVLAVKVGGKTRYIRINDPILASALKNLGVAPMTKIASAGHLLIQAMRPITRLFSRLQTAANPDFVLPNMQADFLEGVLTAYDVKDKKGMVRSYLKNYPLAFKAAAASEAGMSAGPKWDALMAEWQESGGRISFMAFRDLDEIAADIDTAVLGRSVAGKIINVPNETLKFIEKFNQPFESAGRLAMYAAARERGYSKAKAAAIALDASGNYTRRGLWTQGISAGYAFFNPAVQGIEKFVRFAKNPKVLAMFATVPILGFTNAMLAMMVGDDDEDPEGRPLYLQIPEWERHRSIIIPRGVRIDEYGRQRLDYTPIRIPHNLRPLWALGDQMAALLGGYTTPSRAGKAVMTSVVQSFNPMAADNLVNSIAPTALDPAVDIWLNRTWTGTPIVPNDPYRETGAPRSNQFFEGRTKEMFITAAQGLNAATGGTRFEKGWVDIYPGQLQYMTEWATGGAGRFVTRGVESSMNAFAGVETPPEQMPIVRMFKGATNARGEATRYYELRDAIQRQQGILSTAKRNYETALRRGERDEEAWATIERLEAELGARVTPGEDINWKNSLARPFNEAETKLKEKRTELYDIRMNKTLSRAGRDAERRRIEAEIEEIMLQARERFARMNANLGGFIR